VMAQDRVGIMRDVSTGLADVGGNITHLSQTVMRGYFTLIISVTMPDDRTEMEIRQAVERHGSVGELAVDVRPYSQPPQTEELETERFTLSMQGTDQPGIISRTTTYLAEKGINVDDFYACVHEGILLMLTQVSIPTDVDVEEVQSELERLGKKFDLVVHLQHENIFKATSEVRPVLHLQRKHK